MIGTENSIANDVPTSCFYTVGNNWPISNNLTFLLNVIHTCTLNNVIHTVNPLHVYLYLHLLLYIYNRYSNNLGISETTSKILF